MSHADRALERLGRYLELVRVARAWGGGAAPFTSVDEVVMRQSRADLVAVLADVYCSAPASDARDTVQLVADYVRLGVSNSIDYDNLRMALDHLRTHGG